MKSPLGLFQGYGVELEYMIVDQETLEVAPLSESLLRDAAGRLTDEVEHGALCWSNELVMHVVELKTNGPVPTLDGLAEEFQRQLHLINRLLEPQAAMLMPGAMHPWMNPDTQTRLWPHGNREIYQAYDRIFGCRGHGWSNLQSTHLNLPFATDEEFGRLHAAVRLVLPLIPALAAASPVMDAAPTGQLDNRLEVYRHNQRLIPQITGRVIPEQAFSAAEYQQKILEPMYRAVADQDPAGILREEWLNSRGAIARFQRNTIEIRLLDIQECPAADLAIVVLLVAVLRDLTSQSRAFLAEQRSVATGELAELFVRVLRHGPQTRIDNRHYLRLFGEEESLTALELWERLAQRLLPAADPAWPALRLIFREGPLAQRILRALGDRPTPQELDAVYRSLCLNLMQGELYHG